MAGFWALREGVSVALKHAGARPSLRCILFPAGWNNSQCVMPSAAWTARGASRQAATLLQPRVAL